MTAFIDELKNRPGDEIAIVMGDFNFVPSNSDSSSLYHEVFIESGMDVSWRDLDIDITRRNSSRIFKPEAERIGHVIDHTMYDPSKVRAIDGDVIELDKPLSDHKPFWAHLELR